MPAMLDQLRAHWQGSQHPDRLVVWAAAPLCFAEFFRLGELLPAAETPSARPQTTVQWGDITVNDPCSTTMLKTHLRVSKCDQFGKGVNVYVGSVNSRRCPVTAVVAYMANRGHNLGPFFLTRQGKLLTKPRFIAEVRRGLAKAGLDQTTFAGHSFRIGEATTAAQAGWVHPFSSPPFRQRRFVACHFVARTLRRRRFVARTLRLQPFCRRDTSSQAISSLGYFVARRFVAGKLH